MIERTWRVAEFRREGARGWLGAHALALGAALAALVVVWYGRALVPPAPFFLARAVVARSVADMEPVEPATDGALSEATVLELAQAHWDTQLGKK